MIQPIENETPFLPEGSRFEDRAGEGIHLVTPIFLMVHVETILGGPSVGVGEHPALALSGQLHLPELRAEIGFRSQDRTSPASIHAQDHRATATIVPHRFKMAIPQQYLASPEKQESDIWALTPAMDRDPPWVEHYAGQLQEGPLTFDHHIPVDVTLDVHFAPELFENGRGAKVDITGELRFEHSTHVRLLFRDPDQRMAPSTGSDCGEAVWIVAGSRVPIARQTLSCLTGRDPSMALRVIDTDRDVVCIEQPLTGPAESAA